MSTSLLSYNLKPLAVLMRSIGAPTVVFMFSRRSDQGERYIFWSKGEVSDLTDQKI
jgi:hypothetical protein